MNSHFIEEADCVLIQTQFLNQAISDDLADITISDSSGDRRGATAGGEFTNKRVV